LSGAGDADGGHGARRARPEPGVRRRVCHPAHAVAAHGGGDHKRGADMLDKKAAEIRQRTAAKLKQMPGPRR